MMSVAPLACPQFQACPHFPLPFTVRPYVIICHLFVPPSSGAAEDPAAAASGRSADEHHEHERLMETQI